MGATRVGPQARREYLARMRERYETTADRGDKSRLISEVCEVTGYHRKAVIRLLGRPARRRQRRRGRPVRYGPVVVGARNRGRCSSIRFRSRPTAGTSRSPASPRLTWWPTPGIAPMATSCIRSM